MGASRSLLVAGQNAQPPGGPPVCQVTIPPANTRFSLAGKPIKAGLPLMNDTWIYAGQEWKRWGNLFQARPSPRCGHAFAFDEHAGVIVLFGGVRRGDKPLGDTWVFDGRSWKACGCRPCRGAMRAWATIRTSRAAS